MPWRGRMGPTQNLFWNYMLFKMRGFLRKIISMEFSEIKKGGFPVFCGFIPKKSRRAF